jgi:phage terminase large subunit GpA-like protein
VGLVGRGVSDREKRSRRAATVHQYDSRQRQEDGEQIDEHALINRAERFDLNNIPAEVLALTAGVDVQDDRLEISVCGWTRRHECLVLAHHVLFGSFTDPDLWRELDDLLRTKWQHPGGGLLQIDSGIVDAGDGDHTDQVMAFCMPRIRRRIYAGKGLSGSRPGFTMSKDKKRLALVGVDTLKAAIIERLQRGTMIRFSDVLEPVYYEQLASERRVVRIVGGRPKRRFERISRRDAEALDCLVYAHAARQSLHQFNLDRREQALYQATPLPPPLDQESETGPEPGAPPPQHRDHDPAEFHSLIREAQQPHNWIKDGGRPGGWWDRGR